MRALRRAEFRSLRWGARLPLLVLLIASISAHAGPGAHGPGGEHLDAPSGATFPGGLGRLPDGSVTVPKPSQRRMEVRTVLAKPTQVAATIELPARVVADPNASGRVQAAHGGRIEPAPRGLPVAGQAVNRGEVLAYVRHHPEPYALGAQRAQLAELRAQRKIAEQRATRLADLEGTVPRKEIDAARVEAAALAERERSIGTSLVMREALLAPVSGIVARTSLALGQVIEAKDVLVEIVDPSRMLIEATTADPGLATTIASATLADSPHAMLKLVGAARALREGVLPLTFTIVAKPGAQLPLAVGQPVTVIASVRERIRGYALPAQAVVRSPANEPVVWIKSGAERFIPQPVQFKMVDANTVVITQGLGVDNRVVVRGASLLAQIR